MTRKYWISGAAGNLSDDTKWSLSSNGPNDTTAPGASDVAVFDGAGGNNGNCSLSADCGSVTDDGGGVYTVTPGVKGLEFGASYTGTFSRGSYALAIGTDGIAASAAQNGCFNAGAGLFGTSGPVNGNGLSTFTYGTGICVLTGGALGSPVTADSRLYGWIVAEGAHVQFGAAFYRTGGLTIHGQAEWTTSIFAAASGKLWIEDGAVITGAGTVYVADNCTCQVDNHTTSIAPTATVAFNTPSSCSGSGYLPLVVVRNYGSNGTVEFTNTGGIGNLQMTRKNAGVHTDIDLNDTPIYGDLTESADALGTYGYTGTFVWSGNADQEQSIPNATTTASSEYDKTGGTLTITTGDVTQADAWAVASGGLAIDAAYTDDWDGDGNNLVLGGTFAWPGCAVDLSGAAYFAGETTIAAGGTLTADYCYIDGDEIGGGPHVGVTTLTGDTVAAGVVCVALAEEE